MPLSLAMRSRWRKTRPRVTPMSTCTPLSKLNLPNYASAIVTTDEIVGTLASVAGVEVRAGS